MTLLTLHNAMQLYVFVFSMMAVWCVARTDRWHRWGYVFGLLSEPAWAYFAWTTDSWGIMLLTAWWSWSWSVGIVRRFGRGAKHFSAAGNL